MRKAELLQLFRYTDYVWAEVRRVAPDAELSRVVEWSGWPTLRHCLAHMVAAHHRWVPAIIDLKTEPMPDVGKDFATWKEIEAARSNVRGKLAERLDGWSDEQLAVVQEVNVDGEILRYSRGELIAHLLLHERGHHGDVTTLFWQLGIDADLAIEYRFFLGRR